MSSKLLRERLFAQLAFVIPVRVDSDDRLWNLRASLGFLQRHFAGAEVVVVEEATVSQLQSLVANFPAVRHVIFPNDDRFRRADGVNVGAAATERKYVCMYDADVLISPDAIANALQAMESKGWKLVLPFNRIFLDVSGGVRERLGTQFDISGFDKVTSLRDARELPDTRPRFVEGGICIVHREVFLAEGGLNRKMISYGWEDSEMHQRFAKLGYPILHLQGFNLVHLDHSRGADSRPNEFYDVNRQEFLKVKAMTQSALERYVETDLSLTALGDPQRLAALRASQRRNNRSGLLRLRALWSLLAIHARAYGMKYIFRRMVLG